MSERLYCVYIMANSRHSVLYTGVTSDLRGRVWQHVEKVVPGFTGRYAVSKLVYALITAMNPEWRDLAREL